MTLNDTCQNCAILDKMLCCHLVLVCASLADVIPWICKSVAYLTVIHVIILIICSFHSSLLFNENIEWNLDT